MRFLWRNAIFILFPAVIVAIIFLGMLTVGSAVRFGEWGERSIAESALIVTKEKIDRIEHVISTTDDAFFSVTDPARRDRACERWNQVISESTLVAMAVIIDDSREITWVGYRGSWDDSNAALLRTIQKELMPLVDKYDSLDQYKHIHRRIGEEYYFFTHFTRMHDGEDFTTVLLFDNKAIENDLLAAVLKNVGEDRVSNVVDDRNQTIFGRAIDGAEEVIVAKRFPSTLYKWKLQMAPTSAALFDSQAEVRAQSFSRALLIPLAFAVIVLSLVLLYLSVVRERRLNRLKSEFVANVTHELKTPLSLIRMFGELLILRKAGDEAKTRQYHEIILRETERLTALIDNVLNLARIERGHNAYDFTDSSIVEAVDRGIEITRHNVEKQGLTLDYRVAGEIPSAYLDEHAITLAVVNLIDNAVKYATGTTFVGVEVFEKDGILQIDVVDHGEGIPKTQVRRIFERFYRVPSKQTRTQRGSGIGLSLVRHIAEGHGGKVTVTSTPGVETRFSIRIPAVRGQ